MYFKLYPGTYMQFLFWLHLSKLNVNSFIWVFYILFISMHLIHISYSLVFKRQHPSVYMNKQKRMTQSVQATNTTCINVYMHYGYCSTYHRYRYYKPRLQSITTALQTTLTIDYNCFTNHAYNRLQLLYELNGSSSFVHLKKCCYLYVDVTVMKWSYNFPL